ncbi:MAG: hypothetical protein EOM78_20670, partial [Erysipelotrichia bacterium]|nr:hypothetical protein [Erysipelotrichia bacterium]
MSNETFLTNIDIQKLDKLISDTTLNVQYFNTSCAQLVQKYSNSLDNLMKDLYAECIQTPDPSTKLLEKYYLELSNMLYFMGEKLEQLSVFADMSKSAAKEVYAKSYLKSQVKDTLEKKNKTTVAECQAQADLASQYETVVSSIYSHVYAIVKYKINAGQDMMNTLRKIISSQMASTQLSMYT